VSTHTFHPDTYEHGLADGCPRCDEHAAHPLESLDSRNLRALIDRVLAHASARSDNEAKAMNIIRDAGRRWERIHRVGGRAI
jgi:hypothetical protein